MRIKVKVKPNSGKEELKQISEDEFIVNLKKPAEDNKANLELIKVLKKYFKKEVKFIRGLKSKDKILEVCNGK